MNDTTPNTSKEQSSPSSDPRRYIARKRNVSTSSSVTAINNKNTNVSSGETYVHFDSVSKSTTTPTNVAASAAASSSGSGGPMKIKRKALALPMAAQKPRAAVAVAVAASTTDVTPEQVNGDKQSLSSTFRDIATREAVSADYNNTASGILSNLTEGDLSGIAAQMVSDVAAADATSTTAATTSTTAQSTVAAHPTTPTATTNNNSKRNSNAKPSSATEGVKKRKRAKNLDIDPSNIDRTHAPSAVRGWRGKNFTKGTGTPAKMNLQASYTQLQRAKEQKEQIQKDVNELGDVVQDLQQKLDDTRARLAQAKENLRLQDIVVQNAANAVGDVEMKMPSRWNERYAELEEFYKIHGHLDVPKKSDDEKVRSLATWVARQKASYNKYCTGEVKTKKPYKIAALEKLGIRWNQRKDMWDENFEKLVQYKREHGTTVVPTKSHPDRNFSGWITTQRYEYKTLQDEKERGETNFTSNMTQRRVDKLNEIGFVWNVFDEKWKEMFDQLVKYREQFGNVDVPDRYPANTALTKWVKRQRLEYKMIQDGEGNSKRCKLTNERIKKLQEVGFAFSV